MQLMILFKMLSALDHRGNSVPTLTSEDAEITPFSTSHSSCS